ncbi:MAG: radical SAM protein [Euryarchaeota archaeon]|nr:radical SAM protein [Euryarchaeota archaeon]
MRALGRYSAILDGEARPLYLASKAWPVAFEADESDENLLRLNRDFTSTMIARLGDPPSPNASMPSLLGLKRELARRTLRSCRFCERACGADRGAGETGYCGVAEPRVASEFVHLGEEPELVPSHTIFFSGCTLKCVYCQNWDISQDPSAGKAVAPKTIAGWIGRRDGYVRNVNWVGGDPTPALALVLDVLAESDARLAQVWNSNMYLSERAMRILAGTMDVYLADLKYGNDDCALGLSDAPRYWATVTRNLRIARESGELLVRHLVLPGHVECCSLPALEWLAKGAPDAKVNVMAQYRPGYKASGGLARRPTMGEVLSVQRRALELGLDLTL